MLGIQAQELRNMNTNLPEMSTPPAFMCGVRRVRIGGGGGGSVYVLCIFLGKKNLF